MLLSFRLSGLVELLGGERHGDDVLITGVSSLEKAGEGELAFLANPRLRAQLQTSHAAAFIVRPTESASLKHPHIVTRDPQLYFAQVAQLLHPRPVAVAGIHPRAIVDPLAKVAASAQIGPGVVIEAGAVVGERTIVKANAYLGERVEIGDDCLIHPNTSVHSGAFIGDRVILHSNAVIAGDGFGNAWATDHWEKIPQLGRVLIGNDVEIGSCTTVDRGALNDTIIGNGARIDNLIQVAHNVEIGEHTAMAACVGIAGSTKIGARCQIGGAVMISGHLEICDGVTVMGGTLVAKTIREAGVYSGSYPMQTYDDWRHNAAHLRHLDELAKRIKQLEKEIAVLTLPTE
ncbi:UDP-3-O-(3-hydroxymyristoyl)glucosamine N-acyltransferase [Iodobacter fluviatilis]|uniref:UDP-3-O-acylglucosamine N-acyltransferase n=1 Tax=Iodobacter fluviatilis TaxID=537 RepID=A0A377Q7L8_9NEIS|nr:UDP-3-O-(3-hydroxymyristoyl)glucosamine N-acyltransferase [Iodobacter fluviatilis]TCU88673.1 UDP-3-O-[3-hydroxymyristoyl] glucosamine N-acyltransferase [Iodobacter fluviatilis]STQ91256.1 UDP-3-O-acylglucosamine N-acyltransferase [Iodobacter fluviatilis]